MNRRRLIAAVATTALAIAALGAACSSKDGTNPSPSSTTTADTTNQSPDQSDPASPPTGSDAASAPAAVGEPAAKVLESVTWKDGAGGAPDVSFPVPLAADGYGTRVDTPGDGEELKQGDLISFNWAQYNGTDGQVEATTFDGKQPPGAFSLTEDQMEPTLYNALVGQKVGAKVLYIIQAQAAEGEQALAPSLVALIVTKVVTPLTKAEGDPVDVSGKGLPTITLDEKGAPTISDVIGDAPKEMIKEVLVQGKGAVVESGQTALFHYTGWVWGGESFDSSWTRGAPFTAVLGEGQVIKGWDEGLVGVPIGSQVLLIIPPDLAYGDSEQGSIPANSTLIFVVDILAAV